MPDKPARSWGSFSLRTMFILVTLICCYLAYQIYVVRGRQAMLKDLKRGYVFQVTTAEQWKASGAPGPAASVPFLRHLLGDEAVQRVGYYAHMKDDAELRRIARKFPEAKLYESDPPQEPCHPGCFPHGTLISTSRGPQKIEAIQEGDTVYVITSQGDKKSLPVVSIFRTHNRLWEVTTTRGLLVTTETQPLCSMLDKFGPAGELQSGDAILVWNAEDSPGTELQETRIVSVHKTDRIVPVINLVIGNREPFIANGYLARSKPPETTSVLRVQNSELETPHQAHHTKH